MYLMGSVITEGNKRKKRTPSEFEKQLSSIREKHTSLHVVEFEILLSVTQERSLLSINEHLRVIRNTVLGILFSQYKKMIRTKAYKRAIKQYKCITDLLSRTTDQAKVKQFQQEKDTYKKKLEDLRNEFQITFEFARKYGEYVRKNKYSLPDAVTVLAVCEKVWQSMERILYGNAIKPYFYKRGEFVTFQGKQAERSIILKKHKKEETYSVSHNAMSFPLVLKPYDLFTEETLSCIGNYLKHGEELDKENVSRHQAGQPILSTYRIRNNRIIRKEIRGKYRYFVQVTLEGKPVPKRKKDGSFRHTYGVGRIGGDIGTQSAAFVTKHTVILQNLAERSSKTFPIEREIRKKQRYLERSRQAMNPAHYREDGTIQKGKKTWVFSNRYVKEKTRLRDLHRKAALNRKYAHNEDVNRLRSMGDELLIETMSIQALQRKAKEATKNEKTGKWNRRKRYGKSIGKRSPGYLISQAKYRFALTSGIVKEVNTWSFKASQYDHVLDDTSKKSLSKRWHVLPCGTKIQRDIYSAFLLYCAEENLFKPNKEMCNSFFPLFLKKHHLCIEEIKNNYKIVLNSGITFS